MVNQATIGKRSVNTTPLNRCIIGVGINRNRIQMQLNPVINFIVGYLCKSKR